jgi:hypothetical protein
VPGAVGPPPLLDGNEPGIGRRVAAAQEAFLPLVTACRPRERSTCSHTTREAQKGHRVGRDSVGTGLSSDPGPCQAGFGRATDPDP